MAPGTRVVGGLVQILDAAHRAGRLRERGPSAVPAPLAADLDAIRRELGVDVPDALLARGALVWTSLFGAVSFEVFGQYGAGTFSAPDELFEHHIAVLADLAGL
jgi:hypothetical protein